MCPSTAGDCIEHNPRSLGDTSFKDFAHLCVRTARITSCQDSDLVARTQDLPLMGISELKAGSN